MQKLITNVNVILSSLTVVGDLMIAVILLFIVFYFTFGKKQLTANIISIIGHNALLFALIVAVFSTLGSLFYSEIAGYEPCKLCWIQRIFMYPQVLILSVAILKNDKKGYEYILPLSIIGIVISGYHYFLQINKKFIVPCSAVGYSVSCSEKFFLQFGYITIPMMALTAFSLISLFMITLIIYRK